MYLYAHICISPIFSCTLINIIVKWLHSATIQNVVLFLIHKLYKKKYGGRKLSKLLLKKIFCQKNIGRLNAQLGWKLLVDKTLEDGSWTTNTLVFYCQCIVLYVVVDRLVTSAYDKDWKLARQSLSLANLMTSLFSEFVWPNLIQHLIWQENIWWLVIIIRNSVSISVLYIAAAEGWVTL